MVDNMPNHDKSERFYSRKNPRLREYDYSTPNYYFVTVCTRNKENLFGEPRKLNSFGEIAEKGWLEITYHFENASVDKYVVMPNHVHAIIVLQGEGASLPVIVGQYKSHVTRKIHETEPGRVVWQTSFHDHVIRNQKAYEKIWLYIESNPQNWEKDCFFEAEERQHLVGGVMTPPNR